MSGNPRNTLDVGYSFGGYSSPGADARLGDVEPRRQPGHQSPVGADKLHADKPIDVNRGHQQSLALSDTPRQDDFRYRLGEKIRDARIRADYSQTKLAKKLNIQQSAVSQWEKGTVLPGIDNRMKLATALRVPLSEFLETPAGTVPANVFQDPQVQLLVHNFAQLSPPMRTTILVTVAQLLVNERSRAS